MSDNKKPAEGSKLAQLRALGERRQKIKNEVIPPFLRADKRKIPTPEQLATAKAAAESVASILGPKGGVDPKFVAEQKAAVKALAAKARVRKLEADARKLDAKGETVKAEKLRQRKAALMVSFPELQKATAASAVDQPQVDATTPRSEQPQQETTDMRTSTKRKTKTKTKAKRAKSTERRKRRTAPKTSNRGVSGQVVADFMARANGASMDELVKEFKIDAHPMRSKVFYARHTLGYTVEHKDGRYYATAPKK